MSKAAAGAKHTGPRERQLEIWSGMGRPAEREAASRSTTPDSGLAEAVTNSRWHSGDSSRHLLKADRMLAMWWMKEAAVAADGENSKWAGLGTLLSSLGEVEYPNFAWMAMDDKGVHNTLRV
ncbi:hypothetical protein NDU88_001976 [Pleurodeles waltl]|uniref:Uncharacterized protein n=1 Tax=Pleurodeles waltl TaxID=8319 RepID=A0AAV7UU81_PLEWA|nr:hypothetical protein NDU88_001976 [Pleurodeles waltl]